MKRISLLFSIIFIVYLPNFSQDSLKIKKNNRPNILLIVADDLGYSDIGAFGSEIATPFLDKMAAQGLRFSNFHTMPTCAPTRSILLTGADNHLVGLGAQQGAVTNRQKGNKRAL